MFLPFNSKYIIHFGVKQQSLTHSIYLVKSISQTINMNVWYNGDTVYLWKILSGYIELDLKSLPVAVQRRPMVELRHEVFVWCAQWNTMAHRPPIYDHQEGVNCVFWNTSQASNGHLTDVGSSITRKSDNITRE